MNKIEQTYLDIKYQLTTESGNMVHAERVNTSSVNQSILAKAINTKTKQEVQFRVYWHSLAAGLVRVKVGDLDSRVAMTPSDAVLYILGNLEN